MRPTSSLQLQATRVLRSGNLDPKNGVYLGGWGDLGSQTQKNIVSYGLSPNRQRPLAGTANAAVFNTFRRTRHQILYWLPPIMLGYALMNWATERLVIQCQIDITKDSNEHRNEYLNSKPGRLEAIENGEAEE